MSSATSFVTGSRAYGTPREDSDIDLAVCVSSKDLELLMGGQPTGDAQYQEGTRSTSLRFGKLNLLAFVNRADFDAWMVANEMLKKQRPVTRERAVQTIKAALAAARALK
jgi:hypothetical protein